MDNVIYEAKPFYGVNPVFTVFCVITALLVLLLIVFWKKVDTGVHWFISLIIAFMLFVIFSQMFVFFEAKCKVYEEYKKGNYFVVEGRIKGYVPAEEGQPNLPDQFNVNGVAFQVPGFVSIWGYPLKNTDGGVLKEGTPVRIYYIPYKFENVIMKLEILE